MVINKESFFFTLCLLFNYVLCQNTDIPRNETCNLTGAEKTDVKDDKKNNL